MAAVQEDWKTTARELRESGCSEREVAEAVGKSRSTVHSFFSKEGIEPGGDPEPEPAAAEPEPQDEPEAPAEHFTDDADRAGATFHGDNPHLTPFQRERLRMEEQARIGEGGDVEWESESVFTPLAEQRVDGTAQLSMFDLGGKRATDSSLKLQGGRVQLADGQAFRKGDVVRLEVTAVVREVGQRDKPDPATGIVVSAEQKHIAYITDLRVLS